MSLTFSMTGADLSAALRQLVQTDVTAAARRRIEAAAAETAATSQETIGDGRIETVAAGSIAKREIGR